jgi:hypothetical protein
MPVTALAVRHTHEVRRLIYSVRGVMVVSTAADASV